MFNFRKKKKNFSEIDISDVVVLNGEHEKRKLEAPIGLTNLNYFFIIIILVIVIVILRAGQLQVARGSYYTDRAENNRISTVILKSPRGLISDRNNLPLVKNIASIDAVIIPSLMPRKDKEKEAVLQKCFTKINFSNSKNTVNIPRIEELDSGSSKPFLVKENISQDELVSIQLNTPDCPGFTTEETAVREYTHPEMLAHVMGYVGKVTQEDLAEDKEYLMTDIVGKAGLESYWEEQLRGVHGFRNVEVNSSGDVLRSLKEKAPIAGNKLMLGIDLKMQESLYKNMEAVIKQRGVLNGAAVVIDPENGAIRAYVSYPGFNNNLFQRKIDPQKFDELINDPANPLLNRVIGGTFHPGSTFKPTVGAAALQEGVVSPNQSFDCGGFLEIDNAYGVWRFNDWKTHGPDIDIYKALAYSCDVYYYYIGGGFEGFRGLGINKIKEYAEKFGLGKTTGIDLPGERSGFIPTPEWKLEAKNEKWYVGNTYHASIGQGDVSLTPLQVANQVVPIANGGTLYKPHLVTEIVNKETGEVVTKIDPEILNANFIDRNNLEIIKQGMRDAVEYGTLKQLQIIENDVCGKTGTAQIGGTEDTHSWFVGFAPKDDPEFVIAVLVERGGESTDAAVPVAKLFMADYFGIDLNQEIEEMVKTKEENSEANQNSQDVIRSGNRVIEDEESEQTETESESESETDQIENQIQN
ncbi:MAG: penicillin-binding protein 2 [Candidatus Moranbacteria bacterium]|nr:penicillin-binding protein 2 [Candidatus Moranbacteria bacterium]